MSKFVGYSSLVVSEIQANCVSCPADSLRHVPPIHGPMTVAGPYAHNLATETAS